MNYPHNIDECYNNQELIKSLKTKIKNNQLTNTIFYGLSQSCKTTLIMMILQERMKEYGISEDYHIFYNYLLENKMIINGNTITPSGTEIKINDIIDSFIKRAIPNNKENINKIIVIDDFDTATIVNQQKIISIIDSNPHITFFIICENIDKLEKKFISRMNPCYLEPLPYEFYINYLKNIIHLNVDIIDKHVLKHIFIISKGYINNILTFYNSLLDKIKDNKNKTITYDLFINTFNIPNLIEIKKFVKYILSNKKMDQQIIKYIKFFIDNTYSSYDTLEYCWSIIRYIKHIEKYELNDFDRVQLMEIISITITKMNNDIESWILFNLTIQKIIKYLNNRE